MDILILQMSFVTVKQVRVSVCRSVGREQGEVFNTIAITRVTVVDRLYAVEACQV